MADVTSDLMEQLQSVGTPEEVEVYLDRIRNKYPKDLSSYIKAILAQKGMSIADMQKKCDIERTYLYQIMRGEKNPGRNKIIAIAVACEMNIAECQRALEIAQEGILYAKSSRDSLIIYAINKKMSVREINGFLTDHRLEPLS